MSTAIYCPSGIFVVTKSQSGEIKRLKVTEMCVGQLVFSLEGYDQNHSERLKVDGVEIHGEFFEIPYEASFINQHRAALSWTSHSFNLTIFQTWVSGLSIETKEQIIGEVISWHEEIEEAAYEQSAFKRSA